MADEWMIRRQTTSGICHIQLKTASPLGSDLAGPFSTKKDACKKAAELYEAASTDPQKCSGFGGGSVSACSKEGVKIE